MTNVNTCAHLANDKKQVEEARSLYHTLISCKLDPLESMLAMQRNLQIDLHNRMPENNKHPDNLKTIGDKIEWIRNNQQSMVDEHYELMTALGGSNGSASWKPWKSKYNETRKKLYDEMSEDEKSEIQFELVDAWHFFMNQMIALNLSAEDFFVLYFLKNAENFSRYKNGY